MKRRQKEGRFLACTNIKVPPWWHIAHLGANSMDFPEMYEGWESYH